MMRTEVIAAVSLLAITGISGCVQTPPAPPAVSCTPTGNPAGKVEVSGEAAGNTASSTTDPANEVRVVTTGAGLHAFNVNAETNILQCSDGSERLAFGADSLALGAETKGVARTRIDTTLVNTTGTKVTRPIKLIVDGGRIGLYAIGPQEKCELERLEYCEPLQLPVEKIASGSAKAALTYRVFAGSKPIYELQLASSLSPSGPSFDTAKGFSDLDNFAPSPMSNMLFTWDETEMVVPVDIPANTSLPISLVVDLGAANRMKCEPDSKCVIAAVTFSDPVGGGLSTGATNEVKQ